MPLLRKDELEISLKEEKELIKNGKLREDNPLDLSKEFQKLCEACRRGDLKSCQEMITEGANLNARDEFDYTPLILRVDIAVRKASLCGHYEIVRLLLESGALCERDTFQGERCLYNALNDRIRTLLLSYDYSKTTDPLQPFAAHVTGLITKTHPATWDIQVNAGHQVFHLHKMILSARSPYCRKKLTASPSTRAWSLPPSIPPPAFETAIKHIYLGELPTDLGGGTGMGYGEEEILQGLDKVTKHFQIQSLWDDILESGDRRLARQRRTDELARGRDQMEEWLHANVLKHKIFVDTSRAGDVKWDRNNGVFADALLRADYPVDITDDSIVNGTHKEETTSTLPVGIPVGPSAQQVHNTSGSKHQQSVLFPVHRAMLIRSEFFLAMFSSGFREAQQSDFLQIIPIDCTPDVLEVVLTYLYCDKADFGLDIALDVLFAAEMLFIEKLKTRAATLISTLGTGAMLQVPAAASRISTEEAPFDIYEVVRTGWLLRIPRLEEFGARYFAYRLEKHIDEEEFAELIRESAGRVHKRQETDTIELLDDIRFYLSERFRLRFEDTHLEEVMNETAEIHHHDANDEDMVPQEFPTATLAETDADLARMGPEATHGPLRTRDGEVADDEFASDALDYQILLGKIDTLLDDLQLEA